MGKVTRLPEGAVAAIVVVVALLVAVAAGIAAGTAGGDQGGPPPPAGGHDVVTWAMAPADLGPLPGLGVPAVAPARGAAAARRGTAAYRTVRDVVHTSVGGWDPRFRLSNEFGTRPVTFDAAEVTIPAAPVAGAPVAGAAGPERRLTFGGSGDVTIPPGAEALSDPAPGYLPQATTLAVTLHIAAGPGSVTGHPDAQQANYVSAPGDYVSAGPTTAVEGGAEGGARGAGTTTGARAAAAWRQAGSWFYLDGVVVTAPRQVGTVVALGDSITDGFQSEPGANARWPDDLARRLLALPRARQMAVANEGLASNRVTASAAGPGGGRAGQSAEARFGTDVLAQPGVTTVILLEGINDIGDGAVTSARQLIAADSELIAQAHAAGLRILGATLPPFQGAFYYSPAKELVRERVNDWIRNSGAFDGVIDFDRAVRAPADPLRLARAFDSGDHLHPSDAGYRAMANAISLARLR